MREYYINSKKVTKEEWSNYFKRNPKAKVILSTYEKPSVYVPPDTSDAMTEEQYKKAKEKIDKILNKT